MMYLELNKILSYNALLNILIAERGVGKTYSVTKYVCNRFIKNNEEFAYIRRYKSELKEAIPNFFSAINSNNEFPEHRFFNRNNKFFCDDKICGHTMTLATAQNLKSSNFANVTTIIFDEFIIEEGQKKYYLQNEVFIFLNLLETIARMRNIKVFMLANPANTYTNPYFLYFDLSLPFNNQYKLFKENMILVYYGVNEEYRKEKKNTPLGKLVAGTSFEQYAINNKDISLNKNFIGKKSGKAKFSFAFKYKSNVYGVWYDFSQGKVFISYDYNKSTDTIFSCTNDDHTPNTLLLQNCKKYNCWKNLISNYSKGNLFFESMKIKSSINNLFKQILT